jgi:hypothetical protein
MRSRYDADADVETRRSIGESLTSSTDSSNGNANRTALVYEKRLRCFNLAILVALYSVGLHRSIQRENCIHYGSPVGLSKFKSVYRVIGESVWHNTKTWSEFSQRSMARSPVTCSAVSSPVCDKLCVFEIFFAPKMEYITSSFCLRLVDVSSKRIYQQSLTIRITDVKPLTLMMTQFTSSFICSINSTWMSCRTKREQLIRSNVPVVVLQVERRWRMHDWNLSDALVNLT